MFGRLLGWYTIYTFSAALAPDGILPRAKFTLRPIKVLHSRILAAALQQRASAKLCGVVQGMELLNICMQRGNLYSAGRLVSVGFCCVRLTFFSIVSVSF